MILILFDYSSSSVDHRGLGIVYAEFTEKVCCGNVVTCPAEARWKESFVGGYWVSSFQHCCCWRSQVWRRSIGPWLSVTIQGSWWSPDGPLSYAIRKG